MFSFFVCLFLFLLCLVSFCFDLFHFVSFHFVSFRFFVSFHFVSFRSIVFGKELFDLCHRCCRCGPRRLQRLNVFGSCIRYFLELDVEGFLLVTQFSYPSLSLSGIS